MKAWLWFALVQLVMLLATVVGWVVLIPFCLGRYWAIDPKPSIKDGLRAIDRWEWEPLNTVYGNPEDGVSGLWALTSAGDYMPRAWPPLRAYCWSAWRNSADNLKYVFAWEQGPLIERSILGRNVKLGWQRENGIKVPVLSL